MTFTTFAILSGLGFFLVIIAIGVLTSPGMRDVMSVSKRIKIRTKGVKDADERARITKEEMDALKQRSSVKVSTNMSDEDKRHAKNIGIRFGLVGFILWLITLAIVAHNWPQ